MTGLELVVGFTLVFVGIALILVWLPHVAAWLDRRRDQHTYAHHVDEWGRELAEREWRRTRAANSAARREVAR